MAQASNLRKIRSLFKFMIVILVSTLALLTVLRVYNQHSIYLANKYVGIPHNATNINAFHFGFGQSQTLYVKFSFPAENEDELLRELCENTYIVTNPFQTTTWEWWMPYWWTPPKYLNPYSGGRCSGGYEILIDKTSPEVYVAYIALSF